MAKMMLRSKGKPPLARSPIRLRPLHALQSTANTTTRTPPGSLTKSQLPKRNWDMEESDLQPEYRTISYELRSLAKMVHQEFGTRDDTNNNVGFGGDGLNVNRSCLFERGRLYEEYCARRNERLKRKKGEGEKKAVYDLGVRVESAKKSGANTFESRRKTVAAAATPMAERREAATSRYSLRSCTSKAKESKKPPPLPLYGEKSCISERKVGARKVRKN
ncbi:hypothetical protein Fot_26026 [Forsythia ovata]|uniref:Uncharacterized protein n=1 Tax=Forsythia ovata TaxID=205694 RepID=A0ABD1UAQ8_9LAMI